MTSVVALEPVAEEEQHVETERVALTITVAESVVDISMTGVQIDCAQEITAAVVTALLNVAQRDRRDKERARLHDS